MQYLTFRMKGVEYAVDVGIVETVVERGEIMPVPTPIAYLKGAMDLRGSVIPVIDLSRKFGIEQAESGLAGGVVVVFSADSAGEESRRIGALVDEVSEVLSIDDEKVETANSNEGALWEKYVRGVFRLDGRMIVIIDPESMFSIRELEGMAIP